MTTHWHFDHNNGASPTATRFLASRLSPSAIPRAGSNSTRTTGRRSRPPPGSAARSLAKLEASLRKARARMARHSTGGARKRAADRAAKGELAELETLEVVAADPALRRPDQPRLRRHARSRSRTAGPRTRRTTRRSGCRASASCSPATSSSARPCPMSARPGRCTGRVSLRDLEAVPAALIVPGHGPVHDRPRLHADRRELLETTLARVEALVRAGRSLAQVQDELTLDDVRATVPDWSGAGSARTTGPTRGGRSPNARSWASGDRADCEPAARFRISWCRPALPASSRNHRSR